MLGLRRYPEGEEVAFLPESEATAWERSDRHHG